MPDTTATLPSFSAGDILNKNSDFYSRLRNHPASGDDPAGSNADVRATISRSLLVAVLGASFFGLTLGTYGGSLAQILSAMIKLPILLLGTAVFCFPTFHIFQSWKAPKPLTLIESISLQSGVLASISLIWASLAPPLLFLINSTHSYKLTLFLALLVGTIGGLVGFSRLTAGCRALGATESEKWPRFTLLAYFAAFGSVGAQLAWMLRPFIGSPSLPFQLLRPFDPSAGNIFSFILGGLGG